MLEWPHRREIQSKVEEGLRKCKVVLLYGDARTGKSTLAQDIMKDGETYKKISPLEFENVGIVGAADDAFDHAVKNVSHLLIDDLDMLMSPALVWKLCDLVDRVRNGAQYTVILGVSSRAHAIHEKLLRANRFDYWVEMGSLDFIDRRGIVDVLLPMREFHVGELKSEIVKRTNSCSIANILQVCNQVKSDLVKLSESKVNTLVVEEILEKLEILLDEMRAQQLGSTMTRFKIFDSIEIQDLIDFDSEIELLNQYILAPLLHKERYASLGVSLPKGVLLHGPPGCGKTSLAVAFASKAKKDGLISSALMLDSSQIVSKIVGKSENQLSEVFRECRKLSPCILIIDQIEMIAAARNISHSNSMDRTLSTLLIELDGVSADSEDSSVILICTTRNPNLLDPAILRPGRLDVHIQLSDISFQGRKNLLSRLSNGTLSDQFIETFAKQTDGFSAAEIRLLHRTACMNALRESTISPDTLLLESHWQHAINSFSNSS